MKVVILAGGLGTRLSEETTLIPKPMIRIGAMPILWHIMKIYSAQGFNEFIICCGYKQEVIREFFANYVLNVSDITMDFGGDKIDFHRKPDEKWKVTLVDTGEKSMTGGRLKRISDFVEDDDAFFLTYGDGLSDINVAESLAFHRKHKKLATVTAVRPPSRFGILSLDNRSVTSFSEKPPDGEGYINGGFFVVSPKCLELIVDDYTVWENEPLQALADEGNLMAFEHQGFWQSMDTIRDKILLEQQWAKGLAPWKIW